MPLFTSWTEVVMALGMLVFLYWLLKPDPEDDSPCG